MVAFLAASCSSGAEKRAIGSGQKSASEDGSGPSKDLSAALSGDSAAGGSAARHRSTDGAAPTGTTSAAAVPLKPRKVPYGMGVTATTINLGFYYGAGADAATACAALGANCSGAGGAATTDDPKALQKAIIKYVNTHGGIAGRKIVPVWHGSHLENRLDASGQDREDQAACTTWTQDNKTFAIMLGGGTDQDVLTDCAVKNKTVILESVGVCGNWQSEASLAKRSPYYYVVNSLTTNREERAMVASLARRRGFFTKGAKVGLMVQDLPEIREGVERGLKPALAKLGVNVASEAVYPHYLEAPWTNYVVQFQTAGVDRVIFSTSSCPAWPTLFFVRAAENQQYRPLYGIPGMLGMFIQDNGPKEQWQNITGPQWNLGAQNSHDNCWNGQPCGPISPLDRLCRSIAKSAGFPDRPGNALCEDVFFLKAALDGADALTPEGLARAVANLGTSWQATATIGGATRFGPGRYSGATLSRDYAWIESKGRYDFTSGPNTVP
jgi:hypothetical protein